MPEKLVLKIDKPHYVVKLHEEVLEVDLKEGTKKELEDAVEMHPILRESLGLLFQTIVPLDVALKDVESVKVDNKGRLKIATPLRRDIIIPLKENESKRLVKKLEELIPLAKQKEAERRKAIEEAEERPRQKVEKPI